jgi:hypothetical protein
MRVMVVGSRDFNNERRIWRAMNNATAGQDGPHTLVVGGGRRGAEYIARDLADEFSWDIEKHSANPEHGDEAGRRRNKALVASGADVCLAFLCDGAAWAQDAAARAKRAGIPVWRYVQ